MEYSNIKNQDINDDHQTNLPSTISICQHHLMVPIIDNEPEISSSSSSSCADTLNSALRNVAGNMCVRVPRPTNAFMIYANENRKCLAKQYPLDSNKEISKRLGHCWKDLEPERKAVYYSLAKQVDADHKKKYPKEIQLGRNENVTCPKRCYVLTEGRLGWSNYIMVDMLRENAMMGVPKDRRNYFGIRANSKSKSHTLSTKRWVNTDD